MRGRNIVVLLVIAGVLGIVAALWSGSGAGLGPIRMGEGGLSAGARNLIMVLTLIGAVGALITGAVIKMSRRTRDPVALRTERARPVPETPRRETKRGAAWPRYSSSLRAHPWRC